MRAVTLDLWQTLITEPPGVSGSARHKARVAGVAQVLEGAGHPASPELISQALLTTRQRFDADHDRGVDIKFAERVREMLALVRPDLPGLLGPDVLRRVEDAVDQPFLAHPPIPVTGVREVLSDLKGTGTRIALISNTGFTSKTVYRAWFARLGWLDYFDVTSFSNDLSVAKPTRSIFDLTLSRLGVAPARAIHVGDSGRHDVDGAHGAGLHAVWIRTGRPEPPETQPDFTIRSLAELPGVVTRWMAGPGAIDSPEPRP